MTQASTEYCTAFGRFDLHRYPSRPQEQLQAWCAADTVLLEEAHRLGIDARATLLVNDDHGALSIPLPDSALWTDSALTAKAVSDNRARNGLPPAQLLWSTQAPVGPVKLVLLRIPKQLPYLEYQLSLLASAMPVGGMLLAAGMDKHLSPRSADLLQAYIGPTTRHRGQRKARLFSALRDDHAATAPAPFIEYPCTQVGGILRSLPNVFSREQLDAGSRLLLANLDKLAPVESLLDLASGNGVLGLGAFARGLCKSVLFCDESAMAVASARHNTQTLFADASHCFSFHHGDGLADYDGGQFDLVLCNPPFHLQHTVDDFAGRRLLQQAAGKLSEGGQLCLVANRHLNYAASLKRQFREVRQLAGDSKFCIWLAVR